MYKIDAMLQQLKQWCDDNKIDHPLACQVHGIICKECPDEMKLVTSDVIELSYLAENCEVVVTTTSFKIDGGNNCFPFTSDDLPSCKTELERYLFSRRKLSQVSLVRNILNKYVCNVDWDRDRCKVSIPLGESMMIVDTDISRTDLIMTDNNDNSTLADRNMATDDFITICSWIEYYYKMALEEKNNNSIPSTDTSAKQTDMFTDKSNVEQTDMFTDKLTPEQPKFWNVKFDCSDNTYKVSTHTCIITAMNREEAFKKFNQWFSRTAHGYFLVLSSISEIDCPNDGIIYHDLDIKCEDKLQILADKLERWCKDKCDEHATHNTLESQGYIKGYKLCILLAGQLKAEQITIKKIYEKLIDDIKSLMPHVQKNSPGFGYIMALSTFHDYLLSIDDSKTKHSQVFIY